MLSSCTHEKNINPKSVCTSRDASFDVNSVSTSKKNSFHYHELKKIEKNWLMPNFSHAFHQQKENI